MKTKKYIAITLLIFFSFSVSAKKPKREMRAVWIATVANIDWPSKMGLSTQAQKSEMIRMLCKLKSYNINTIFIQVRPTADTFYPSHLEPWSRYITGKQGYRPRPYYDPLKFIIEEAHKRCIEVHAWINPYRVANESHHIRSLAKDHLYQKRKELFVEYGGKYYFNPGYDETRDFLNKVVKDIVIRYDIDGVHFDDYFYPYPVRKKEFPDQKAFLKNPRGFKLYQKADWRRNNVNMVIKELQKTIKEIKPWVQFGVSPFGVWRNKDKDQKGSYTTAGVSNYDDLYADVLKWLKDGSIDYVVPQLYWEIGNKRADYRTLVKWWSANTYGKNLYIGLYASGLNINKSANWKYGNQLAKQLKLNQKYPRIEGVAFFSAKPFLKNHKGLLDTLRNNYYKYPSIHPIYKNIRGEKSLQPQNLKILKKHKEKVLVWDEVKDEGGCKISYYVVYGFKGKKIGDITNPANIIAITADTFLYLNKLDRKLKGRNTFVVTSINRYREESKATERAYGKL